MNLPKSDNAEEELAQSNEETLLDEGWTVFFLKETNCYGIQIPLSFRFSTIIILYYNNQEENLTKSCLPCFTDDCSLKRTPGPPWWLRDKEAACQRRRLRFSPWSGKIPWAVERLSLWTTTTEPVSWSPGATATEPTSAAPRAWSSALQCEKPARWEAHAPQLERGPHSLQLEKKPAQQRRTITVNSK